MKNLKIFLLLIFFSNILTAQEGVIVPFNTLPEVISGTYIKDIQGELLPYIGSWEGTKNDVKYTFLIVKLPKNKNQSPDGYYYYEDLLVVKIKATNLLTNAIYDLTPLATLYKDYRIISIAYPVNNSLGFTFFDFEHCNNQASFALKKVQNNPNLLTYCCFSYDDYFKPDNCTYDDRTLIPLPIPKVIFTLIKL